MNVIEAGKAAGLSTLVDALSKTNHHYAISMAELERFTQIIRKQALEEAAVECDKRAHAGDAGALMAARAIRAMQKGRPTVQNLPADETEGGAE